MKKRDLIKFLECFDDEIEVEINPEYIIDEEGYGVVKNKT